MAELLEKTNSSYFQSFKNVFTDVVEGTFFTGENTQFYTHILALEEAQDNEIHLKSLKNHFEDLEQAEFDEAMLQLEPLLHVICLVWANSKFYNTPARLIVLLQETCNLLISMVSF